MPEYKFTAHYHCVNKPFNVDLPATGKVRPIPLDAQFDPEAS